MQILHYIRRFVSGKGNGFSIFADEDGVVIWGDLDMYSLHFYFDFQGRLVVVRRDHFQTSRQELLRTFDHRLDGVDLWVMSNMALRSLGVSFTAEWDDGR